MKNSYEQNIEELDKIVTELESDEMVSFDDFSKKAKRAEKLLQSCKKKLYTLSTELRGLYDD